MTQVINKFSSLNGFVGKILLKVANNINLILKFLGNIFCVLQMNKTTFKIYINYVRKYLER